MTWAGISQRWRRWQLARRGVDIDRTCTIGWAMSVGRLPCVHPPHAIKVGPECDIGSGVELNPWGGRIHIGRHVFVGPYTVIYGHGGVEIGDHTLIAMHCCIVSSNHTIPKRTGAIRSEPDILMPVKIGRDVWLGAGVKVLGGVTIGDGCVVGAGAVVTRDLPPYAKAVGIPAKIIGYRT
jgi:acetyltransferase-like isoleucine patch superfamily enzyme